MFRKPFKVKFNTQMRSCDQKKLKLEILRSFPTLSAENLKEIMPFKEDLYLVKVLTYSGEPVQFYCCDRLPILISRADKLYPTVYLLWKFPNMIPHFTTASEVLPALQGGADFMAAGIQSPDPSHRFGHFRKNDVVYINLSENKAAIAVGDCALSSEDMYMSGGRGKCVLLVHVYEDELCKFGSRPSLPRYGPAFTKSIEEPVASDKDEKQSYANLVKQEQNTSSAKQASNSYAKTVKQEHNPSTGEMTLENLQIVDIPKEITAPALSTDDDIVVYCFLKALNTSVKNVKLPLLISNFYKVHMIPACPQGKTVDIKKSRFKKMSKLVQEMASENVIKIEEASPGVQSISAINYSHHLLSGFVDDQPDSTTEETKIDRPQFCEKYSVTAAVLPIFSEFLIKKGDSMTVSDARKYIAEYIRKYKLPLPEDASMVKLDDVLKSIVARGPNDEVPDIVKWEEIMNRVLYKMSRSFKITSAASSIISRREHKGKIPLIDIRIANKSGNKKVTLIDNLEAYGINIEEFSRECQRGVAASATINQIPGMKSSQLQIQGNQIIFIQKILEAKYNIPKKYMNGLQFAPKKK